MATAKAKQGSAPGSATKPETKLLEAYLRARGLSVEDVPNYVAVSSVSALPGVKLAGAKAGFQVCYPDLAGDPGDIVKGLSRARITDPKPPLDKDGKPVRFNHRHRDVEMRPAPGCLGETYWLPVPVEGWLGVGDACPAEPLDDVAGVPSQVGVADLEPRLSSCELHARQRRDGRHRHVVGHILD